MDHRQASLNTSSPDVQTFETLLDTFGQAHEALARGQAGQDVCAIRKQLVKVFCDALSQRVGKRAADVTPVTSRHVLVPVKPLVAINTDQELEAYVQQRIADVLAHGQPVMPAAELAGER